MKKILLSFCAAIAALAPEVAAEVPDSVYVYLYTNVDENVRDGLYLFGRVCGSAAYAYDEAVYLPPAERDLDPAARF